MSATPTELEPLVALLARQLAEQLRTSMPASEPWITVEQAAEHIAAPCSRIYDLVSQRAIPHGRDGRRLIFRRSDLDHYLLEQGHTP